MHKTELSRPSKRVSKSQDEDGKILEVCDESNYSQKKKKTTVKKIQKETPKIKAK
jgi:hypothetical protein